MWAGANALAIALREALALELGVEADEMGFAVGQSQNALGAPAVSLFLFDRATGGAGFAVSLEHLMRPVIRRAEQILDCVTPGCEKACAACVLTSDAPGGKDELDRTAALAFLRAHLKFPEVLRPDDRFVDAASLSLAPLDEIDRELRRSARSTLTIFLPDRSNPAALQDWPLAAELLDWRKRGHGTRLALEPALVTTLSTAEKLGLRDFALQHRVGLVTADAPVFANGAHALAMVHSEGGDSRIWATREAEPRLPGPTWGRPIGHPVARGSGSIAASFAAVDLDMLLPPPGAQLVQIGPELDCDLATFGARASKIIVELLRTCGAWPKTGIVQAVYRDSYVSSPLVARLLIDTMKQISRSRLCEGSPHHRDPSTASQRLARRSLADLPRLAQRRRSESGHRIVGGAARRRRFPASKGCAAWPLPRCRLRRWRRRDHRAGPGVRRLGAAPGCDRSLRLRGQSCGPSKATSHRECRSSTTRDWQDLLRRDIGPNCIHVIDVGACRRRREERRFDASGSFPPFALLRRPPDRADFALPSARWRGRYT